MSSGTESGLPTNWVVDKKINVAHLLTTFLIIVSVFKWASVMETRLVQQEERMMAQQATANTMQNVTERQMDLIRSELNTVRGEIVRTNTKLDRLLEFQLGPPR